MAASFRPHNRLVLRPKRAEHIVRVVFDNVIVNAAPLRSALGPRLNIDVCHPLSLPSPNLGLRLAPALYTSMKKEIAIEIAELCRNRKHAACGVMSAEREHGRAFIEEALWLILREDYATSIPNVHLNGSTVWPRGRSQAVEEALPISQQTG